MKRVRAHNTSVAEAIIARHSKSFALASKLLPGEVRDRAVVVYAWCRRADDAVDEGDEGDEDPSAAVLRLTRELDENFAPSGDSGSSSHASSDARSYAQSDGIVGAFCEVAANTGMPRLYADEMIAGMEMDARDVSYPDWETLLKYCYRVAGTVGLMMSHVMGVAHPSALRSAVHLGLAMQLTNISRDVREDWDRGRLYLPDELLDECGASGLRSELGRPLPLSARSALAKALGRLLDVADRFYESGDAGLPALSPRCAWAVGSARAVYAAIGHKLRALDCDVFAPRVVVDKKRKLQLVSKTAAKLAPQLLRPRSMWSEALPTIEFSPELYRGYAGQVVGSHVS